jgi:hypothetical protein
MGAFSVNKRVEGAGSGTWLVQPHRKMPLHKPPPGWVETVSEGSVSRIF